MSEIKKFKYTNEGSIFWNETSFMSLKFRKETVKGYYELMIILSELEDGKIVKDSNGNNVSSFFSINQYYLSRLIHNIEKIRDGVSTYTSINNKTKDGNGVELEINCDIQDKSDCYISLKTFNNNKVVNEIRYYFKYEYEIGEESYNSELSLFIDQLRTAVGVCSGLYNGYINLVLEDDKEVIKNNKTSNTANKKTSPKKTTIRKSTAKEISVEDLDNITS